MTIEPAHQPDDDPRAALADGPGTARSGATWPAPASGPAPASCGRRPRGAGRLQPRLPLRRAPAARRGGWFEATQAAALAGGTSGRFYADVDFARLAAGANGCDPRARAQAGTHLRLAAERARGRAPDFPEFGGHLQPYLVFVPKTYTRTHRAGHQLRAALAVGHLHPVRGLLAEPAATARRRRGPLLRHPARPRPGRLVHRRGGGRTSSRSGPTWRATSGSTPSAWR